MKLKGKEFILFLYISIFLMYINSKLFGFFTSLIIYITLFFIFFIFSLLKIKRNNYFNTYFGVPGSGKSTVATYFAIQLQKQNLKNLFLNSKRLKKGKKPLPLKKVFACNISIVGAIPIEKKDINVNNKNLHDCLLIIDESGISYNNRNYSKNFTEEELKIFKYHRKRNIDILVFSQSYEDMDKKLRDLSNKLYFLKKSLIPFFVKSVLIQKTISIDKETKQIIDSYHKVLFSGYYVFMPKTWSYFDTTEEH